MKRTIPYGPFPSQVGDLYLPATLHPPVVCLLHGGFWRMPYGREEFAPVAEDLVARGFAVWNLEYRRVGEPGGGWPGTLQDVVTGIDHLATFAAEDIKLDLTRVSVVGHSAGGHLALWSAARSNCLAGIRPASRVQPIAAVGLAAIIDLAVVHALNSGGGAVGKLLGGSPTEQPNRYAQASPAALLPLRVRQLLIHGTADEALPVALARNYTNAATAAGDEVEFVELASAGHMVYLDPGSEAHAILCRWLSSIG